MSRQEQNDRHIIWSDISLDLDDWRESLEELYPGYSDDELYDIMVKSNAENLYDERVNLNIQLFTADYRYRRPRPMERQSVGLQDD